MDFQCKFDIENNNNIKSRFHSFRNLQESQLNKLDYLS